MERPKATSAPYLTVNTSVKTSQSSTAVYPTASYPLVASVEAGTFAVMDRRKPGAVLEDLIPAASGVDGQFETDGVETWADVQDRAYFPGVYQVTELATDGQKPNNQALVMAGEVEVTNTGEESIYAARLVEVTLPIPAGKEKLPARSTDWAEEGGLHSLKKMARFRRITPAAAKALPITKMVRAKDLFPGGFLDKVKASATYEDCENQMVSGEAHLLLAFTDFYKAIKLDLPDPAVWKTFRDAAATDDFVRFLEKLRRSFERAMSSIRGLALSSAEPGQGFRMLLWPPRQDPCY